MTEAGRNTRTELCRALTLIAWGYVVIYLDINLGPINLLPNWLGFALIFWALAYIAREIPTAALLRPLSLFLGAWNIANYLLSVIFSYSSTVVTVIAAAVTLYFHFQLLTDLATLAEHHACPQAKHLLRLRTVNTLLTTVFSLPLPWKDTPWVSILLLLLMAAVAVWICVVLFGLRKSLKKDDPIPDAI